MDIKKLQSAQKTPPPSVLSEFFVRSLLVPARCHVWPPGNLKARMGALFVAHSGNPGRLFVSKQAEEKVIIGVYRYLAAAVAYILQSGNIAVKKSSLRLLTYVL